ncbi:toprim domain-containing protein [Runella limosa]|uniref:toprim domain-containing protein n=1 Tax=Runella limosa TaxID=370978 RepID=UPI000411AE8A|nr:toprim domain-containing protein [Runella limosa]
MYDIKKLKMFPIVQYLKSNNIEPLGETGGRLLYFSPYRAENTPSFYVHEETNTYKDFGNGERGGDIIDLVQLCERIGRKQAFERVYILLNTHEVERIFERATYVEKSEKKKKRVLLSARDLQYNNLIKYCEGRGIPEQIARLHLSQVHYLNPDDSKYTAVGMRNRSGGYEIRFGNFKSCIGEKDITILSRCPSSNIVSVFEGMFDFLSMYVIKGINSFCSFGTNAVILHSTALWQKFDFSAYDEIRTYFDNDETGVKTTKKFAEKYGDKVKDYSTMYLKYNDLNEYLCQRQKK